MDYLFSQHDLSFLDDVIPEKEKKKKEDEKRKKKKKGSLDSDIDDVRNFPEFQSNASWRNLCEKSVFLSLMWDVCLSFENVYLSTLHVSLHLPLRFIFSL